MQLKTKNKLIPNLRFREFKENWEKKTLGDYYKNLRTGMTPSRRNKEYFKGDISWITSGELNYGVINDTTEKISDLAVRNTNLKVYPPYTFFIAITGLEVPETRGKCGLNGVKSTTNQSCMAFEKIDTVETMFLFYWYIKYGEKFFFRFAQGTKQQSFNNKIVEKFEFCLPSLTEQKKIAEFLSSVDKKIELLEKKKEQLELYKKGLMQKIFSQEIRFNDDNGYSYLDWKKKKLGDLGVTYNGLSGKTKEDFGKGKPFIEYLQVFNSSKVDVSNFGYVNVDKDEKQNTVKYGDILFTTSSEIPTEVGFSSVLNDKIDGIFLNSFCFGYRPYSLEELHPEFSAYLFRCQPFRKQILRLAQGSTRYNMSKIQLLKIEVKIPSLHEQKKIGHFLSSVDKKIDSVSVQIEKTKEFKKGLLQQMFV